MRPHDVVILAKIIALGPTDWYAKDVAHSLRISNSEVSESLHRSQYAGLIDSSKRRVFRQSLLDLLIHGLKYVFPQQPGAITTGMPTAHSAPVLAGNLVSQEPYVWPDPEGTIRGQAIEPLHGAVAAACRKDPRLYDLLALIDALRVGKVREQNLAKDLLKKRFDEYQRDSFNQPVTH